MPYAVLLRPCSCFTLLLAATVFIVGQAPAQSPTAAAIPTLKVSTQLVVVDVVVTDKGHRHVHGLKLSDFTLTEDSKQQAIGHFEEHTAADMAKMAAMPKLPAGIFTNAVSATTGRPVNVLLLDAMNTSPGDQAMVREQLIKYLRKVAPGTPIAIYGLGSQQLTILQGVTSDANVLSDPATLARIHDFRAPGRSNANRTSGPEGPAEGFLASVDPDPTKIPLMPPPMQADLNGEIPAFMGRYGNTLDALGQLGSALAGIPGRKNLIWFSGSFPASLFHYTAGNEAAYQKVMDQLTRSQVAIYSIYVRGVGGTDVFGADFKQPSPGKGEGKPQLPGADAPVTPNGDAVFNILQGEHGTMSTISAATGGRAFLETNDFAGAMAEAIDEGSSYYTLSYVPSNTVHDGEFRKIKVQLDRRGLALDYRPDYYADSPEAKGLLTDVALTATAAPPNPDSSHQNLMRVMTLGTPTPTEMLFHVGVVPETSAGESEEKPAPGNAPAANTHGPYRRYSVNYNVDQSGIGFLPGEAGKMRADLEFVIFVFAPDGTLVNAISNTIHMNGTQEEIKQAVAHGLFYHQEVSAPVKGESFLRIVVHDLNRDRFGAVEVATSAVKNVVPRTALPSSPPGSGPEAQDDGGDWETVHSIVGPVPGMVTEPPANLATAKYTYGTLMGNRESGVVAGSTNTSEQRFSGPWALESPWGSRPVDIDGEAVTPDNLGQLQLAFSVGGRHHLAPR